VEEPVHAVGPAAALGAITLLLARRRRSRRLAVLGATLFAVELLPPYRTWITARARRTIERAEADQQGS
jgi:hypothetical protein